MVGAILGNPERSKLMLKYIAAAILASSLVVSTAFAASNDYSRRHDSRNHQQSEVHKTPDRYHRDRRGDRYDRHHSRYRPGERYRSAPHGWHRYHKRPRDWHNRGCIVVGPMWFCP
jgi:hypothetical protein